MPRRSKPVKRPVLPDARFNNVMVSRIINKIMTSGKKSTAERIVYGALHIVENDARRSPTDVLEQAVRNATPVLEVKPRRVGGATYQVPVEIRGDRRLALAIRWLVNSSRARNGRSMAEKLAAEVLDAYRNQGATVKRKEDTHRMADANKAFVHYRW